MAKGEVGRLWVRFGADTTDFDKAMQGLSKRLEPVQKRLSTIGSKLTMRVTLPMIALGTAATRTFESLETGLANVSTLISGDATERMAELEDNVRRLALRTGKHFDDLTGGLYEVISAFGDSAESAKNLQLAVQAGVAGVSSTKDALKLLSAVTKAYGDVSYEAQQRASDLAFMTVKLGQTTFPELASSMQLVLSTAEQMRVPVEELFATFATLTGVTGGASEVSTQIGAVLGGLMAPTEQLTAAIEDLEYATAEAMVEELGLVGALQELIARTDGTSASVRELFARKEALRAVFALTGRQAETFASKLAQMSDAAGMTDEAFGKQMKTFKKTREVIAAMFRELMVRISKELVPFLQETLIPWLENTIGKVTEWFEAFQKLAPETKRNILKLAGLVALTGPLLKLGAALFTVTGALAALHVAAGPVGWALLALGATVGGASIWKFAEGMKAATAEAEVMKNTIQEISDLMSVRGRGEMETARWEWATTHVGEDTLAAWRELMRVYSGDVTKAMEELAKLQDQLETDPLALRNWLDSVRDLEDGALRLGNSFSRVLRPIQQAADATAEMTESIRLSAEEAEKKADAERELRRELASDVEREIMDIHEKAKEYQAANADQLLISQFVYKKRRELAEQLADEQSGQLEQLANEQLGQLERVGTKMEEVLYPRWHRTENLWRRGAEAGVEARYGREPWERFRRQSFGAAADAASGAQGMSGRDSAQILDILRRLEAIGQQLVHLEEMYPSGRVR